MSLCIEQHQRYSRGARVTLLGYVFAQSVVLFLFALAAKTLEDAIKEAVQTRQDLKRCKDVMLLGNFDGGSAEIAPFERTEWLLIADCDLNPFWPSYHQLQQVEVAASSPMQMLVSSQRLLQCG